MLKALALATSFACVASSAMAGAPNILGDYAISISTICQETLALTKKAGNVTDIKRLGAAQFEERLVQANFNANQTFTFKGTKVFGDNTIIQGQAGILAKQAVDNQAVAKPFFADDVKLILNGKTYNLVYGAVDGTSAVSFIFQRLEGKCAVKGIALRQ
jgi:hypothetical protein